MAKHYPLTPSCSPAIARQRWQRSTALLTKDDYDSLISRDAVGTVDGETKFVFLKGAFAHPERIYRALRDLKYSKSKRGAGRDVLFGVYYDPRNGPPRFTNQTREHRLFYDAILVPFLDGLGGTVRRLLPAYWKQQKKAASGQAVAYNPAPHNALLRKFAKRQNAALAKMQARLTNGRVIHNVTVVEQRIKSAPIFSTVTINRSALFPPHRDAKNRGLACQMAFGEFVGGDLCFPRLRVAFRVRPGDLLIADTSHEYHGSVGGAIWRDRISVVAYLR